MPPKGSNAAAKDKDKETSNGSPPPPVSSEPMTAAQKQAAPYMAGLHEFELPKTVIQRLAKSALPDNIKMQQEVTQALLRSSTVFISYLTAAAHDVATARGAKSVTANDIMNAIDVIEFGPPQDLRPIMEKELAAFRNITAGKKASRPSTGSTAGRRLSAGGGLKDKGKTGVIGATEDEEDNEMVDDDREPEHEAEAEHEAEDEHEAEAEAEAEGQGDDVDMVGNGVAADVHPVQGNQMEEEG